MTKKIFIFLIMMFVVDVAFCSDDTITTFLEFIFEPKDFRYETYHFGNREMIFAYQYRCSSNLFYEALILDKVNSTFQPLLFISQNKIIDPNGQVIFEGRILTQTFYGWSIFVVERNKAFSLKFYTNDGVNVTEGPTILWDEIKKQFKLYAVDRSQW